MGHGMGDAHGHAIPPSIPKGLCRPAQGCESESRWDSWGDELEWRFVDCDGLNLKDDLSMRPVSHRRHWVQLKWELPEQAPPSMTRNKELVSLPTAR
ncbi:MAG: hypothetical protein FJ404_08150 [Verrucomicrobia bacterium]|nr:hypothetical protein [Verrucomicrobiota bacterium]